MAELSHESLRLHRGTTPLVLSLPHVGTHIPEAYRARFVARAMQCEDTDWHLDRLYDFAIAMGATVLIPKVSRYVIDLNRPPDDTPMYPGASNTERCPTRFFTGEPLYADTPPSVQDIAQRHARYWQPYHDALAAELQRVRAVFGYALLWDGHSIRCKIPWLFAGTLPDLNLGTASGASCAPSLQAALESMLAAQRVYTLAVNGRFKGGYITRHYGQPTQGIHAVQMEMCQSLYMDEQPPYAYDAQRALAVQTWLQKVLQEMLNWRPEHGE
jgi:N-formylglutamate deformylase